MHTFRAAPARLGEAFWAAVPFVENAREDGLAGGGSLDMRGWASLLDGDTFTQVRRPIFDAN